MEGDAELEAVPADPELIRRTLTARSSAARQVAVNFMPSRQPNTVRRRRNSEHNVLLDCEDEELESQQQADVIVQEMELHQVLMEDNPEAEALRKEAVRDLPQGLPMKRRVRSALCASVSLRAAARPVPLAKRLSYRIHFAWRRGVSNARGVASSIQLWYEAIRHVEGHFGSAVGSFFYFLRFLFQMNLVICIFVLGFVVAPQVVHDDVTETSSPQNHTFRFLDFISGKGMVEDSVMFYGHYTSGPVSTQATQATQDAQATQATQDAQATQAAYYMPFAYFFTAACLYLACFAVLCYRTAYSYRRNFIGAGRGGALVFAGKLFCGWDFSIASPQAAQLNSASIYNELKELLSEYSKRPVPQTFCMKLGQGVCNVVVAAVTAAGAGGLGAGAWRLLQLETRLQHGPLLLSLLLTAVVALCPVLFQQLGRLESYKPRTKLYLTLGRTWLVDIGSMVLLLYYWADSSVPCWENHFGQETYRLVLLDSIVSLFLLPIIEFVRGLLFKLDKTSVPPEFNIAYNSLTLIYNQALVWFALVFAPLLVLVVTAKFLLLFYVKKESAFRSCRPARKVWRAAQTQTVLYTLVTLSMFTAMLTIGSLFLSVQSAACGPFRGYAHVYGVLTEGVLQLARRHTLRAVLAFLARPGVIAFLILGLGVCVYYVRARAGAHAGMADLLRALLALQAHDKEFLLTAIEKVSSGEWLYNPKLEDSTSPDSHTWKYLKEVRKPSNAGYHFDASRLNHSGLDRPKSYAADNRPTSSYNDRPKSNFNEDGDTDSSFSWQGSSSYLNRGDETEKKK